MVDFFLHILSSLVNVRLHTENWLCNLPGSASKVCVVGGGGWVVQGKLSDQLWLSFSLALAKPNNRGQGQQTQFTQTKLDFNSLKGNPSPW